MHYPIVSCSEGIIMFYFTIGLFIGVYLGMTVLALLYMAREK
jgi:hypothetical protein